MSKEEFKEFIKTKPNLVDYIKDGTMTWQKFYELYDIYGDNDEVWNKYIKHENKITDYISKLNLENLETGLEKASKALDLINELSKPSEEIIKNVPKTIEPIDKFFGE